MSLIREATPKNSKLAGVQTDRKPYEPPTEAERLNGLDVTVAALRGNMPSDAQLMPAIDPVPADMVAVRDAHQAQADALAAEINELGSAIMRARNADQQTEVVRLNQRMAAARAALYEAKRTVIDMEIAMLDHMFTEWRSIIMASKEAQQEAQRAVKSAQDAESAIRRRLELVGNVADNNRRTREMLLAQREEMRQIYRSLSEV